MKMIDMMHQMVKRFCTEVVDLPIPFQPSMLKPTRKEWARTAFLEEIQEFAAADTIDEQADALIDLTYFALGRLIEMGIAPLPLFEEVHNCNMRKIQGEVSKRPGSLGHDAVKPDGWNPPNLLKYMEITQADLDWVIDQKEMADMWDGKDPYEDEAEEADTFGAELNTALTEVLEGAPEVTKGVTPGGTPYTMAKIPIPKGIEIEVNGQPIGTHTIEELEEALDNPVRPGYPKIMVIGYARHGKDTVGEMLRDMFGAKFTSSSMFCAERVMMPQMMHLYSSTEECFNDRHNHRQFWYDKITEFNTPDKSALGKAIFEDNDVYVGCRNKAEFHSLRNNGVFDFAIWVDRSDYLPPEEKTSCTLEPWMADYVIDNNGSLADLERNVRDLMEDFYVDAAS
jgi:hypothetical protein